MAQKEDPKPGDWYSEVKLIVNEFELNISDEIMKNMPENVFKNIVMKSTYVAGLKYLKMKQSNDTTNDYKYINLRNGTLREKIETFKQINQNKMKRNEDSNTL